MAFRDGGLPAEDRASSRFRMSCRGAILPSVSFFFRRTPAALAIAFSLVSSPVFAQGGGVEAPTPPEAQPAEQGAGQGEAAPSAETPPAETPTETPPPEGAATPPEQARMRMVVIDAATFGIDPVVGRVASGVMRETGEAMGYHVLTQDETIAAAQQLRMPYPPTPADLWRVSWVARAHRGAFARIWAHGGQYVVEITVASLDGSGPFFARGTAGAEDLRQVVDQLLRTALPPPSAWNAAGAMGGTTEPQAAASQPIEEQHIDELDEDAIERPMVAQTQAQQAAPELRRFQLTLQTEAAFGASSEFFYNHLVGVRFDIRITRDILVGAYVGYANLNARNGRADNLLFMAQFEDRIRISPNLDLTIPLRIAGGYLPFNGPVIRLAAGLNYAIDGNWEIGADLLTPTIWFLPDHVVFSMDVALEATYRF